MEPVSTLLQFAPLVLGGVQGIAGLTKKTPAFPTRSYATPESTLKALSNAEYMASQTQLPGYENIKSNIGENIATGIDAMSKAADSPVAILQGIQRLTGGANESLQQLGIAGAENYQRNQAALRTQQNLVGNYEFQNEQSKFQDALRKYEMDLERKQALTGAGIQNLFSGLKEYNQQSFWNNLLSGTSESVAQPQPLSTNTTTNTFANPANGIKVDYGQDRVTDRQPINLEDRMPKGKYDFWTLMNG